MKFGTAKNNRSLKSKDKRYVSPSREQDDQSPQFYSQSTTTLRSNMKKPSSEKSSKRVVIQDLQFQSKINLMLYHIQQFFIKRITKYEQDGFDAISAPYLKQVQLESQIRDRHVSLLQRNALQQWIRIHQREKSIVEVIQIQLQNRSSLVEQKLDENVSKFRNQHVESQIFNSWKKVRQDTQNFIDFKNPSLRENLRRFLEDVGTEHKQLCEEQSERSLIQQNKISKREVSKIKQPAMKYNKTNSSHKTPVRPPVARPQLSKSQSSFMKNSTCHIQDIPNHAVSRVLFRDTPSKDKNEGKDKQLTKNLSAHKLPSSQSKRNYSQPSITDSPGREYMLKNPISTTTRRKSNLKSNKIMKYNQQSVLKLVDKLQNLIVDKQHQIFDVYKKDIATDISQNDIVLAAQLNLKRRIIFAWNMMLPEMKVEKFQLKFKLQKLIKSIKRFYFMKLRQIVEEKEPIDRIQEFLDKKRL